MSEQQCCYPVYEDANGCNDYHGFAADFAGSYPDHQRRVETSRRLVVVVMPVAPRVMVVV